MGNSGHLCLSVISKICCRYKGICRGPDIQFIAYGLQEKLYWKGFPGSIGEKKFRGIPMATNRTIRRLRGFFSYLGLWIFGWRRADPLMGR